MTATISAVMTQECIVWYNKYTLVYLDEECMNAGPCTATVTTATDTCM